MPFPLIAMAAKFLMPMVTKMVGGMLSGGVGGILGKLGNFGDMLGGILGKGKDRANDAQSKQDNTAAQAKDAGDQAKGFLSSLGQALPLPMPSFNLF